MYSLIYGEGVMLLLIVSGAHVGRILVGNCTLFHA